MIKKYYDKIIKKIKMLNYISEENNWCQSKVLI